MLGSTITRVVQHLLVATDGSATGDRAVSFAIALASRYGSDLSLCFVIDHAGALGECSNPFGGGSRVSISDALDEGAKIILASAARRVTDAGLVATTVVLEGAPAQAIVACARERHADAIVMGTQGKRGLDRFFLGSTAEGVLRHTDAPAFVVPPGAHDAPAFARILVAVDDSDPSEAAADFALELAATDAARLVFCSVAESYDVIRMAASSGYDATPLFAELRETAAVLLRVQADRAGRNGIAFESVVTDGDATEQILQTAAAQHVDMIVVGTHGRRGLRRLFVGSVAESIVRRSPVPVVVVRASSLRSHETRGALAAAGVIR